MPSPLILTTGVQEGLGTSVLDANAVEPYSGTALTLGAASSTVTVPGNLTVLGTMSPPMLYSMDPNDPLTGLGAPSVEGGAGAVALAAQPGPLFRGLDIQVTALDNLATAVVPLLVVPATGMPALWSFVQQFVPQQNTGVSVGIQLQGSVNNTGLPADVRTLFFLADDGGIGREYGALTGGAPVVDTYNSTINTLTAPILRRKITCSSNMENPMVDDFPVFGWIGDETDYTGIVDAGGYAGPAYQALTGWANTGPWTASVLISNRSGLPVTATWTITEMYMRFHPSQGG